MITKGSVPPSLDQSLEPPLRFINLNIFALIQPHEVQNLLECSFQSVAILQEKQDSSIQRVYDKLFSHN